MNFFTGLGIIKLFNSLFELIDPYTKDMVYWRGTKRISSTKMKRSLKFIGATKNEKFQSKDEFLRVLMRLRLGLSNENLADRFCISRTHCSNIFKTWIRLLSKTVGKLVAWLPKESVIESMPSIFKTAGHGKLRCIIDCFEVFIERPKKLDAQTATWSDYKSHNTIKFLIGISPTGFITFPSHMVTEQVTDSFVVVVGFLTAWIVMMKLWQIEDFRLQRNS